jgi:hypothetical protein
MTYCLRFAQSPHPFHFTYYSNLVRRCMTCICQSVVKRSYYVQIVILLGNYVLAWIYVHEEQCIVGERAHLASGPYVKLNFRNLLQLLGYGTTVERGSQVVTIALHQACAAGARASPLFIFWLII